MTDNTTQRQAPQQSWLAAEVDGRSVRSWIVVAIVIAAVTLGFGAWWVWGLDRGVAMDDMAGMDDMPHTDVRLPPVQGFYEGEEIFFTHPEASDPQVADRLTEMMAGSPVLVVPELADAPADAVGDIYVFTNGVEGMGPFGFQLDVFPSAPGDEDYSPLRRVLLVSWQDEGEARELTAADEVVAAEQAGDLDVEVTETIVNMPFLTWPDGQR